jgi:uncharacterized DUF497 family protein
MKLSWDESKRLRTLFERGLDFADAEFVFGGKRFTLESDQIEHGEARYITVGYLGGRFVVIVWTQRDDARRIISMRYGHEQEEEQYKEALG